jgi:hypothetical protein
MKLLKLTVNDNNNDDDDERVRDYKKCVYVRKKERRL